MSSSDLKNRFLKQFPDKYFLDFTIDGVSQYLAGKNWLNPSESVVELEKPGEGNMNLVVRVRTNQRSFILKQARPWVEKYPWIPAPLERNLVEAEYYRVISKDPFLRSSSPEVLGHDEMNHVILLSDLGISSDYTFIYGNRGQLKENEKSSLTGYLSALHRFRCSGFPHNGEMRRLNHDYIFMIPFNENNGLDLDAIQPGLKKASMPYTRNHELKKTLEKLGAIYLSEGPVLIHGDYFPGSWIKTRGEELRVIDPEFGFMGYPEFDLGVLIAHMLMSRFSHQAVHSLLEFYHPSMQLDPVLLAGFTGTEILRRLIGLAQLPLTLTLHEKSNLMRSATGWIVTGNMEFF